MEETPGRASLEKFGCWTPPQLHAGGVGRQQQQQAHPSKYTQIPIKHSYDLQWNCVKIINWSMINIVNYRPRKKYYVYSNPYLKYIDIIMGCKNMYDIDITIIIKVAKHTIIGNNDLK